MKNMSLRHICYNTLQTGKGCHEIDENRDIAKQASIIYLYKDIF